MKKNKKRLAAFLLGCMLLTTNIIPVNAAPMQNFPLQSTATHTVRYTRAIQVMMVNYNTITRKYILNAGGIDGSYGNGTASAVIQFQVANGLTADGICGKNTWSKLRYAYKSVDVKSNYRYYTGLSQYYGYNMREYISSGSWDCYVPATWYYVG